MTLTLNILSAIFKPATVSCVASRKPNLAWGGCYNCHMEVFKRVESFIPNWERRGKTCFSFKSGDALSSFSNFVTDVKNAPIVLSSNFYEIIPPLRGKDGCSVDTNTLRNSGAQFFCDGIFLPKSPLKPKGSIGFRILDYQQDKKVVIESMRFQLIGHDLLLKMLMEWNFDKSNKKADFTLVAKSRINAIIGIFLPSQRVVDREMSLVGAKIKTAFLQDQYLRL